MADVSVVQNTNNALVANYTSTQIFIGANEYRTMQYTNGGGAPVTLAAGRLMGLVFATNKVLPHDATATDGSQVPYGILKTGKTVAAGATVDVVVCVWGKVAEPTVTFTGAQTKATTVSLRDSATNTVVIGTIDSLLLRAGIFLEPSTEMTAFDNQPA